MIEPPMEAKSAKGRARLIHENGVLSLKLRDAHGNHKSIELTDDLLALVADVTGQWAERQGVLLD